MPTALGVKSAIGLDSLYYAVQTSDDPAGVPVYGTIYPLVGAKTASFNAAASLVSNFADDSVFELMESMGEKALTISVVDMLPADEARILGYDYLNGAIIRKASASSPYIAIMGRTLLSDGSYGYFRYYKTKFGKANSEDATREASPSPRMMTLEGRVSDLISTTYKGKFMEKVRSDDTSVPAGTISSWFTSVGHSTGALGAVTVSAAPGTAGQVVFTFTKVGGNTNMSTGTFIVPKIQIFLNGTGAVQAPTWAFGATGGATQTATASGNSAGASSWLVSSDVQDVNGIGCTAKGGTLTIT